MGLQASSQVYRGFFPPVLEYDVEGAVGIERPNSEQTDRWRETARWVVSDSDTTSVEMEIPSCESLLGAQRRSRPGSTG